MGMLATEGTYERLYQLMSSTCSPFSVDSMWFMTRILHCLHFAPHPRTPPKPPAGKKNTRI